MNLFAKVRRSHVWALTIVAAACCVVGLAHIADPATVAAQGGNLSSSTVSAIAFNNVTATGVSAGFQNIGQAGHWLTYCPDANVATINIEMEGSYDNVTWFSVAPPGTVADAGCATLEAGGYYPFVRANLVTLTGAGAHVSAYYSGSGFPLPGGGISQLGKSSQPITLVPAKTFGDVGNPGYDSCPGFVTVITGPLVLYNFKLLQSSAQAFFLDIQDSTGTVSLGPIFVPVGFGYREVPIPMEGVQLPGDLQIRQCAGAGGTGGTPSFSAGAHFIFSTSYKSNQQVSTKVNASGVVSGTRKGQP